jgi:hypothetical protein
MAARAMSRPARATRDRWRIMSFREENRLRREQNAFDNLYAYAKQKKIADPKKTAERAARQLHAVEGARSTTDGTTSSGRTAPAPSSVPHRLDDRTRDQLYERAQELDIEGRSQMNKDELIEAIRARQ